MSDDPKAQLRLKTLDHCQAIIQRLAGNSFLIKGWTVTLASALLGIALKDDQKSMAAVAYLAILPMACFWLLDAYYLACERIFRTRYAEVAGGGGEPALGSTQPVGAGQIARAAFAPTTVVLYLGLLACELLVGSGRFARAVATLSA